GKFIGMTGLGFLLFIGSAALVVAAYEATKKPLDSGDRIRLARRTALLLIGFYLVICSTPLINLLYHRVAPLAVMGLVVLAGFGFDRLCCETVPAPRWSLTTLALALVAVAGLNAAAFLVYPQLRDRVTGV